MDTKQIARELGRSGGMATLSKYGREHYQTMLDKRWSKLRESKKTNQTLRIRKLYSEGFTIASLSKKFDISRQRVHQIIKDYKTIDGNKLKKLKDQLADKCAVCGKKAQHLHHKDGDTDNNKIENLTPLCASCHQKIHSRI